MQTKNKTTNLISTENKINTGCSINSSNFFYILARCKLPCPLDRCKLRVLKLLRFLNLLFKINCFNFDYVVFCRYDLLIVDFVDHPLKMEKEYIRFYVLTHFKLGNNATDIHRELCAARFFPFLLLFPV